jgi:hypothetical protein
MMGSSGQRESSGAARLSLQEAAPGHATEIHGSTRLSSCPSFCYFPRKSCRSRNGMPLSICTIVVLSFIENIYERVAYILALVFDVCLHSQLALHVVGKRKRRETYHDYCGRGSRDPL